MRDNTSRRADFKVRFITKDGSLVMDRTSHSDYYFTRGKPDEIQAVALVKMLSRHVGERIMHIELSQAHPQ